MARALYRQYRSKSFREVVGQEHITDLLSEAIARGTFSHAYLFTGPRGVGKTSVARILAHEINKLPYTEDTHLDIIEIDAASNRRIDDIRDLREKVHIAPSSASYKVYIIDEVHMLTGESFNALLKTLEEPPAHVVFILATTELHKVPATIVSRTQRFQFHPVEQGKVIAHLRAIADKEGIKIDDGALHLIAEHGEGSFRDSISLLDQLSTLSKSEITAKTVETLLGLAPHEQIHKLVDEISAQDENAALATLNQLLSGGSSAQSITDQLLGVLPEAAQKHPQLYELINELLEVPRSYSPRLKLLAAVARAALKPCPGRTVALSVSQPPSISAPVPKKEKKATPKSVDKPATPEKEEAKAVDEDEPIANTPREVAGFDWDLVMNQLQKRNAPLHSVLKRASKTYENGRLTLEFAYNLHKKKLEDSKYRGQLATTITDLCGDCPEIVVTLKDASKPPSDATAASVAAIMGGGEQVNA